MVSTVVLSAEAKSEMLFWLSNIALFNGQYLWPKPSAIRVIYSDAKGYGVYTVEHGSLIANDQWSGSEATQSSTWRELRALRMVLESYESKLCNQRMR